MAQLTYRPQGMRIIAIVAGAALVAIAAALTLAFPPEIRDEFTTGQVVTLVGLLISALLGLYAIARCRIEADDTTLIVVNGFRKHRLQWNQVARIRYRDGAPWPVVNLHNGRSVSLIALQASDGHRVAKAVRELHGFMG